MVFFSQWQTWEKLVFVLALAIVITVLAGCIKLGYTHWQLRRYAAIAAQERRDLLSHRQMSQRRRPRVTTSGDEVPFGIRAIESGIQIDGVWISCNNTPEPLSRETSASSSIWEHVPRIQQKADLEKQMLVKVHDRSVSNSSTSTARHGSFSFDCSITGEKLPSYSAIRAPSPEAHIARPPKSHYPPCSYARFSNTPYIHRPSQSISTIEGLEAIHKASTDINPDGSTGSSDSSNHSGHSGNDVEPISASAPRLLNNQAVPRPRPRHKSSSELDLMDHHRISQVAETGQLTPRVRKPGQSVDLSTRTQIGSTNSKGTANEQTDYFGNRQKLSPTPPDSGAGSPTDLLASPKIEALPANIRRSSMPNVTPFAQFCQTAPSSPRLEGRRSPCISGLALTTHKRSASDADSIYVSAPASPVESIAALAPTPAPFVFQQQPNRTSFEKRESQVMRGHGSGFEIMKPGTFSLPTAPVELDGDERIGPPVSLHNARRPRSSSADSRRRLQKKRRPSVGSGSGDESGRRSRESVL